MIKAFSPQLQSTFIKAIRDEESGGIREQAHTGLSLLIRITPRTDALLAEAAGVVLPPATSSGGSCPCSREVQLSVFRAIQTLLEALTKPPNAIAIAKLTLAISSADEYVPDFDGDDDRETEALVGRVVERVKEAMKRW